MTGARVTPGTVWCIDDQNQELTDVLRMNGQGELEGDGDFPAFRFPELARMRARCWLASLGSLSLVACAAAKADPSAVERAGIASGELSSEADDAVVQLRVADRIEPCTGTLVAPNLLITTLACVALTLNDGRFSCQLNGSAQARTMSGAFSRDGHSEQRQSLLWARPPSEHRSRRAGHSDLRLWCDGRLRRQHRARGAQSCASLARPCAQARAGNSPAKR